MSFFLNCALLLTSLTSSSSTLSEEVAVSRVYNHLLIDDPISAVYEARQGLKAYPDSLMLKKALVEALLKKGDELEAIDLYNQLHLPVSKVGEGRILLENIPWGVLNKADKSSQLEVKLYSLIGSGLTSDVKAVPILLRNLNGSNSYLRAVAVKLAASYGDTILKEQLKHMLKHEKIWYVRCEVIRALGQLKVKEVSEELKKIIYSPKTIAEEKFESIVALVNMYDKVDGQELRLFLEDTRAGFRELAAELISHFDLVKDISLLLPLLEDSSYTVRLTALNALGLVAPNASDKKQVLEKVKVALDDPISEVAITACWAYTILSKGEKISFDKWIFHSDAKIRRSAAAALAATGSYGKELAWEYLKKTEDPFVQVNLSLGLIGQRYKTAACNELIYQFLKGEKIEMIAWGHTGNPLFRAIMPSQVFHIDDVPNYPQFVDHLTRLDLINVLAITEYSKAELLTKEFLRKSVTGVSGVAMSMLIEEGKDFSLDKLMPFLDDPDDTVRVQAAFLLAVVGREPRALEVLQQAYPKMDREMKMNIIQALGYLGDERSVTFLLGILEEPFQLLRVTAASSLIQCLNH